MGTKRASIPRMVVSEVMTENPATVDASRSVREVLRELYELDVRHLPVVDNGQLVGIVSDRDMRAVTVPLLDGGSGDQLDQSISDLMSSDVVSVDPEMDLTEVVDLMIEHRIGAVPVVAPETQDLVGIVSYIDILKAARDSL